MKHGKERRQAERVQVKLEARWEGVMARREGTIVDISATGCFLLTADHVTPGELVRLEIQLPTGRWIYLWAEVVYRLEEMGFALRFNGSNETELTMLGHLLDYVGGKQFELEAYW